ncbi:Casein kinase II subunit alpha [Porphyridium purpureum]|uniref:non-specific serine/threonine protein kinase n=1 Tax=Porphyridium purpureum TaxID=35688 RepID=A0A5J4Z1Q2_PORPP|nr:Casein kinase II subunit alpha [Porphyridium purpureum]|eukprot:POR2721..scf295_1
MKGVADARRRSLRRAVVVCVWVAAVCTAGWAGRAAHVHAAAAAAAYDDAASASPATAAEVGAETAATCAVDASSAQRCTEDAARRSGGSVSDDEKSAGVESLSPHIDLAPPLNDAGASKSGTSDTGADQKRNLQGSGAIQGGEEETTYERLSAALVHTLASAEAYWTQSVYPLTLELIGPRLTPVKSLAACFYDCVATSKIGWGLKDACLPCFGGQEAGAKKAKTKKSKKKKSKRKPKAEPAPPSGREGEDLEGPLPSVISVLRDASEFWSDEESGDNDFLEGDAPDVRVMTVYKRPPGAIMYDPHGSGPKGTPSSDMEERLESGGQASVARVYKDIHARSPVSTWDYDRLQIIWASPEPYTVVNKLGSGKYSDVYEVWDKLNNRKAVAKILQPVKKKKYKREIRILEELRGGPNIIELYNAVMDREKKVPVLIFEYVDNHPFRNYYPKMQLRDLQYYMYQVLRALEFAHSKGIIHRDIKPHNIMIDSSTKQVRVADWGLSEFYHEGKEYNVRVASRYFKPPELLLNLRDYDYSLDMWSLGCVLAQMMFGRDPMFKGADNDDQLVKIVAVKGIDAFENYMDKYGLAMSEKQWNRIPDTPGRTWKSFVTANNEHLVSDAGLDLLDMMLQFDHQDRVTAKDAMQHPFFDLVRDL